MSVSDAQFLRALEACQIPNTEFRHRDHLRAAWLYVTHRGAQKAVTMMERIIRRFAAHHGQPDKFNATLTAAWVKLVAVHAAYHADATFDTFIAANAALLNKDLPLRFYSRATLFSDHARAQWIEPDVRKFPTA